MSSFAATVRAHTRIWRKSLKPRDVLPQDAELREADLEHNNGVYYAERLQPVPADSVATLATGVKRSADKAC